MIQIQSSRRRYWIRTGIGLAAVSLAGTMALSAGLASAGATPVKAAGPAKEHSFSFKLVPSPGIKACLPHIGGSAKITAGDLNDTMTVSVHGLPPGTGLDLFVIQEPNKPFGLSWYQTDVQTGRSGAGTATVRGVFDSQTFSVVPGTSTPTPTPVHQTHIGLWFNNPRTPFNLGCESGASVPVVTPFNGEQHAGIQVLNTANFAINKGPLTHLHR